MATSVIPANLTTSIAESITLNGVDYTQTTTKTIASVTHVSKRIMTVSAGATSNVATFLSAVTNQAFDTEDTKYIRITNLDDTTEVIVTLSEASTAAGLELKAGASLPLFSINANGAASKAALTSAAAIEEIHVHNASGAAIDLELFIAGV
tara:strand:- start:604 stop:1056 length:453 start_codon:yes stop_codon:yes gene_type:complete